MKELILLFIIACCGIYLSVEGNCYCVQPENGANNCTSCHSKCHPLSYYTNSSTVLQNNSAFHFLPGEHRLQSVWRFDSRSNISLVASCNDSLQVFHILCGGNNGSGLVFKNVVHLTIFGLKFFNCGNITYPELRYRSSSLFLINVWNLNMSWVEIHNSTGWGMFCSQLLGNSSISNCVITNGHYSGHYSGGNLRFRYVDSDLLDGSNVDHNINVSSTIIANGTENGNDNKTYAGGIDIYFSTTKRITMVLTKVTVKNNAGYDGGNVAITYATQENDWSSSVTFIGCHILSGTASHHGGGIYLESQLKSNKLLPFSNASQLILKVVDSNFTDNQAKSTGGGVYVQVHENQNLSAMGKVRFQNCSFEGNIVTSPTSSEGGSAVHVVNFRLPGSVAHHLPQYSISFEDCLFQYNGPHKRNKTSLGCGVLFIGENGQTILRDLHITDNNCTGLAAAQSTLDMHGTITIERNTGFNGGGILLCANAVIFLSEDVEVYIQNNYAQNYGGGIYAEFECSEAVPPCFYGTDSENISVYLVDNNASKAGDAVYGGSIDRCFTASNSILRNHQKVPFDNVFSVNQSNSLSIITSDPFQVCFCNHSRIYDQKNCSTKYNISIHPGEKFSLFVVVVGQRNGTALGDVKASYNTSCITLGHSQESQVISSAAHCTKVHYTISTNQSVSTQTEIISLSVANGDFQTLGPTEYIPTYIDLTIKQCPYGFSLNGGKCECSNALRHVGVMTCDIQNKSLLRHTSAQWWLGFDNRLIFCYYCPFDFCNNSKEVSIDMNKSNKSFDHQCAFNRKGILCGRCQHGHSNILGSSRCIKCNSFTALDTLALTLLFGFLGILLIIFLGVLNLNVTEGAISPIIFYANIVRVNQSIFFDSCNATQYCLESILAGFIAWTNLDLEIDMCYYNGMTVAGKTALQFVFPFYLWILTGLIIYLSRWFTLVSRIAGKHSVRLLATIILLSYAKMIRTIIDVMWHSTLYQLLDSHFSHYRTVWKMDGDVQYFQDYHKFLFLFAMIIAILTFPYTFILLFIQCLKKVSHYKVLFWVVKWKPFFDAYTGPYRDKYHFWPGFLLLVRIVLFIAIAANVSKGPILNLTLVCITAAILFLLNQPGVYKSRCLSLIESFSYFNLILFSIGTAYVLQQNYSDGSHKQKTVLVCVGSMFLLFCGIITWNICKILNGTHYWGKLKIWLQENRWPWKKRNTVRSLVLQNSVTESLSSSSSSEDELDPILHNAPPVARYDQLREPLVETN